MKWKGYNFDCKIQNLNLFKYLVSSSLYFPQLTKLNQTTKSRQLQNQWKLHGIILVTGKPGLKKLQFKNKKSNYD